MTDNKQTLEPNEYKCAYCKGVFEKGWTDEEAIAESKENFGYHHSNMDVVCDDCYNEFWKNSEYV